MRRVPPLPPLMTALAFLLTSGAVAHAQPEILDEACLAALDVCSVNCSGLSDRAQHESCLTRCNKAVGVCLGDDEVTLRSEEIVGPWGDSLVFKAGACHDTTPCPPEYGSCASWSSFEDCGDPYCGLSFACKICNEWNQCTAGPATLQNQERYRVCFNAQQQACTEYQRFAQTLSCGC